MDIEGPIRRIARVRQLTYRDIGAVVDLSSTYVAQLACGMYPPGRVACEKIHAEFGEVVTLLELVTWRPSAKPENAA